MALLGNADGSFVATGKGVGYVRLASLKGMLNLESKGLKSRAGPLRPKLAAEFGLKPRAPYTDFIAAIQAKMEEMLPEIQEENRKHHA